MGVAARRFRSLPWLVLGFGLFAALAISGLRQGRILQPLELAAYDQLVRLRPPLAKARTHLVLIQICERDIKRFGHPISDARLAQALEMLSAAQPRAIGVDLVRDRPVGEGGARLASIVAANPRIVMTELHRDARRGPVAPPYFLQGRERVGFADLVADSGGIIRRTLLILYRNGQGLLSLPLKLALTYLQDDGITLQPDPDDPHQVRLQEATLRRFRSNDGGYVRADDGGYQVLLDFRRGPGSFPSHSLADLLEGEIDARTLRGKIVLLGSSAVSVQDEHHTPFSTGLARRPPMRGIEIHAHVADQLLRAALRGEVPARPWHELGEVGWVLLCAVVGAVIGLYVRSPWHLGLLTAAGIASLVLAGFVALLRGWWIPVVPAAGAAVLSIGVAVAYVSHQDQIGRQAIMQLFGRFVSPGVAAKLWAQRDEFLDEGRPRPQRLTSTVLIADLRGFTSASETLSASELMNWVNAFMVPMAERVEEHGGIVDDYAGDGLKANFGFPVPRANEREVREDAVAAVQCAQAMGGAFEAVNSRWRGQGLPTARLRIGVFTGDVVAGSIGSAHRLKYTTVGDTVNIAALLEGFDKDDFEAEPGTTFRVLIGETTWRYVRDRFQTQYVGAHRLKRREEPTAIHRVLGPQGESEEEKRDEPGTKRSDPCLGGDRGPERRGIARPRSPEGEGATRKPREPAERRAGGSA